MLKRLDESAILTRLLENTSNSLARWRGLPVVLGIVLIIISMVLQSVDVYSANRIVTLAGVITHNLGVLIALIGLLIATPIGK